MQKKFADELVRIFADYVRVNERSKPRGILLTDITLLINYGKRKRMKETRRGTGRTVGVRKRNVSGKTNELVIGESDVDKVLKFMD